MKDRAYCKVNLSLNIKRRREDGFHELESIMLPIDFYDVVEIDVADEMSYSCNQSYLVFDEHNTVVKAIELMKATYGIEDNFAVSLSKHIPMQAGLAGGSADGAAVIRILNRMYKLEMSDEEIRDICLKIGSDVVFVYHNRPALVSGIGEELEFFDFKRDLYVLLAKPARGVSTRDAYVNLKLDVCDHPDVRGLKEALIDGSPFLDLLGNSLEESSLRLCRDIRKLKQRLEELGAVHPLMSGSGSTVFVVSEDEAEIKRLYDGIKPYGYFIRHTRVHRG